MAELKQYLCETKWKVIKRGFFVIDATSENAALGILRDYRPDERVYFANDVYKDEEELVYSNLIGELPKQAD